jgi:hypothetical protein
MQMYKIAVLLLLLLPVHARATSCLGPITVCSSFDRHSIVFRGRVAEVFEHPSPETTVTYPDGSSAKVTQASMSADFRFEVLEVFKGDPGREITISGGAGEFRQGQEYIIFASPNPTTQTVQTSVCSGNRMLADHQEDADLAWLRAYPTAPPTVSIFGKVSMGYGVTNIPLISIKLSGEKSLTASTAEDHSYAFKDLPPGAYTVAAVLPVGYTTLASGTTTFSVQAKGCAEVDWAIRHDTHIRGTLTDTAGNFAPNVPIGLLRPAQNRTGFDVVTSQHTDANGNYDFSKVDAGVYWIALYYLGPNNREPHAPVYYPSGASSSSAEVIHLGASETREQVNLVLTPALHPVSLRVHVINQDGTPVIQAHVIANDPLTPTQAMVATADANGNADITLYEGREYRLVANTSGNREPACAGPVKFIAKEGLVLNTLLLDKTFKECRTLQHSN